MQIIENRKISKACAHSSGPCQGREWRSHCVRTESPLCSYWVWCRDGFVPPLSWEWPSFLPTLTLHPKSAKAGCMVLITSILLQGQQTHLCPAAASQRSGCSMVLLGMCNECSSAQHRDDLGWLPLIVRSLLEAGGFGWGTGLTLLWSGWFCA